MNIKIKKIFINVPLIVALYSFASNNSFAQQVSIFQQITRAPKDYSNLVPPSQYVDSFLGQDRKGPYVLTWKSFNFGPGNPVWVSIDNQILPTASYDLDISKGEITFGNIIKRTQVVKVSYGYYPELASKNINPTMVAPLTLKIASLGYNSLNITTFNNDSSGNPNFVLGYNGKFEGLSSNIYFVPGSSNFKEQSSMRLGYTTGNSQNGVNINFVRNAKNFSSNYGKPFGLNDALQALNYSGNFTSKTTSLGYIRKDSINLQNNTQSYNENGFVKITGSRNQPIISYSSIGQDGIDSKGIYNFSSVRNGVISQNFGALDLAYKTNETNTTAGKVNSKNDQDSVNLGYKFASNSNVSFNRINESSENNSMITRSKSDKTSISTNLAGGSIAFNSIDKNITLPNNQVQQVDRRALDLGFKGNGKRFSGFQFSRVEDSKIDLGNNFNSVNNKGNFDGTLGRSVFKLNFNKTDTNINGTTKVDQDQENILFSLPSSKLLPVAKFTRNDDIKRDPKGILVGTGNDLIDIKTNFSGSILSYQSKNVDSYTPDGKLVSTDVQSSNFSFKAGNGLFNTEFIKNNSLLNNVFSTSDNLKYSYTIPGNNKGFSGFKLQRSGSSLLSSSLQTDTTSNEFFYGTKIGPLSLTTNLFKSNLDYSNDKTGFVDKQNLGLNYSGSGRIVFSFNRGGNVSEDLSGVRLGSVNDIYSLSSKSKDFQWSLNNLVSDVSTSDRKRVITNTDLYSFKLPTINAAGIELERSDANALESNQITNIATDKIKLNSKFGSVNLVASTGQVITDKNNSSSVGLAKDNTVSLTTPIWGRGASLGVTVNNYNSVNGITQEDKNGLGLSISPLKGLTLSTEQQENNVYSSNVQSKSYNGQKYGLNFSPTQATMIQTSIVSTVDGNKTFETYDYRAVVGNDKTLFRVDSAVKIRNSSESINSINTDSANANLNIRPAKNIILSGNYILNPEDPAKLGTFTPIEKRQYALTHKAGSFEFSGSYTDTEHLKGTPLEVISKANGFYYYGETGFKLGWKSGPSTSFTSEYKNQFFKGSSIKGSEIFSLGLNHSRNSTTFSLSSSYNAAPNSPAVYRAEAKLGYKF